MTTNRSERLKNSLGDAAEDFAYRLDQYRSNQRYEIRAWYHDAITQLVWGTHQTIPSEACPMCGWPAPVQVAAAAETIKDWLDQQAEAGIDPYVAINTVNTEQILAELRNSEALQVNLALAQTRYNAKEKARLDYLYGGGLAKQNEQRLQRWREQKSRKPVE